jgi:hypothetical protein
MKTMFRITSLLILVIILGSGKTVLAVEKTKKYHESWSVSSAETVDISNKFGEVKFTNNVGSEITIDVLVTVEATSESKANDLLDKIEVKFSKSGNVVKAETSIENNFRSQRSFSIDYTVNVPSDKNLRVANKYGNVVVNNLTGTGEFDVQYGNITAVSLKGASTRLNLAYGKGNISETGDLETDISYSNISFGETGNLRLNSKYSGVDLDKAKIINAESRYDKFNFGEILSLIADTKYSQVRISKLLKSLQIGAGYGGIRVDKIDPGFETINVNNSYGNISLGLAGLSYTVDAECSYCGISYPQDQFKGNRMKENTSIQIQGKIGTAGGGNVVVKSRYGEIKLGE